jgi:hypothetical protein
MRVQQSVEMLSEATKQAILDEHRRRLPTPQSELDLPTRLSDPAFLASLWNNLTELEQSVIGLFVRSSARGFLSKKQWDRLASQERHLSVGVTKLRRLGVVFTVRKLWSEIGYLMPWEVREAFTHLLVADWRRGTEGSQTLPYYIPSGRGLHLDVFALLLHIRDHDVPLTQRRTVHRRFLQRMCPLVSLKMEHVQGITLIPRGEEGELPLRVLLDTAMRLGLIVPEEKRLSLDAACVREWLRQPSSARWEGMYQLVCEQYLAHEPWLDAFAVMMKQVPSDQWCSLDEMLKALTAAGFDLPAQASQEITQKWLHLLLGFGWIQLGQGADGQIFWRWNGIARMEREEGWFVDPAGAVTIPPLVPLDAVWKVSRFCSLQVEGEVMRGALQAKLVQAFLANGGTEQQVLETLARHCVHPLPESVGELVRLWARSARQIQMEPFIRVRTANPVLLDELRQIPAFQPYLQNVISSTDFLIPFSQEQELAATFRHYGYEPQLANVPAARMESGTIAREAETSGLFSIERPWDGYAVENTFPDPLEGLPQIAALPKMWTRHLQAYHPQTMRDLLRRAQELQMEVQVERENGALWQGIPQKVEVEMGYWYVTLEAERKKQRFRLEDVKRARIVIPDYLT